ncbi:glutamate racemase [Patescibacteria group bacterium]|nr:glutamate racemase [Patescibacteria group bacterium]MBU1673977.1 glutamate racemase [Patescibacteria group bacterium]MBU1962949.1 glutamate racemase [Patescibacteria group bacterium]
MIGIFDSGLGGLGIFKKIKAMLPDEDIYYYGDTANIPYGEKSPDELKGLITAGLKYLEKKGVNIIVIACNTASVLDTTYFRRQVKIPVVAVVPVIKTASNQSRNNKIALLSTKATAISPYTDYLIEEFAPEAEVKKIACSGWVEAIEKGKVSDHRLNSCLKKVDEEDVVVLGCTHYTLIKGDIQRLLGPNKILLDSNEAVARQVLRVMNKEKLYQHIKKPRYIFDASGHKKKFQKMVDRYLEEIA